MWLLGGGGEHRGSGEMGREGIGKVGQGGLVERTMPIFEIACFSWLVVDFLRRRSSYTGFVRSVNSTEARMAACCCCCWARRARYWGSNI